MAIWIKKNRETHKKVTILFLILNLFIRYILPIGTGFLISYDNPILYLGLPFAPHFFYLPAYLEIASPVTTDLILLIVSIGIGIFEYVLFFLLIGGSSLISAIVSTVPNVITYQIKESMESGSGSDNCCGAFLVAMLFVIFIQIPAMLWNFIPWELIVLGLWRRRQKKRGKFDDIMDSPKFNSNL